MSDAYSPGIMSPKSDNISLLRQKSSLLLFCTRTVWLGWQIEHKISATCVQCAISCFCVCVEPEYGSVCAAVWCIWATSTFTV